MTSGENSRLRYSREDVKRCVVANVQKVFEKQSQLSRGIDGRVYYLCWATTTRSQNSKTYQALRNHVIIILHSYRTKHNIGLRPDTRASRSDLASPDQSLSAVLRPPSAPLCRSPTVFGVCSAAECTICGFILNVQMLQNVEMSHRPCRTSCSVNQSPLRTNPCSHAMTTFGRPYCAESCNAYQKSRELNCVYGIIQHLSSAPVLQLVRASDQNSEVTGSNCDWISLLK